MKLSSLVKSLQEALFIHGDMDVIMASDEEGNSYHNVDEHGLYYVDDELVICLWPGGYSVDLWSCSSPLEDEDED